MAQLVSTNTTKHRGYIKEILGLVVAPKARVRSVYFYGEVGIGKTTLLHHLIRKLQHEVPTTLISYTSFSDFDCFRLNLITFIWEIVQKLGSENFPRFSVHLERIKFSPATRLQLDYEIEVLKLFQDECRVISGTRPIVLIFDDFEQVAENSFGEWFINHFSPNLIGPLIIFAGRFPLVHVPDTFRVNHLQGFGREESKKLLTEIIGHTLHSKEIDELLTLTRGNPRLLEMAAHYLLPLKDIDWQQITYLLKQENERLDAQEIELRHKSVIPYWAELIDRSRADDSSAEQEIRVEFVSPNLLHVQMSLPPLVTIDDYFNIVGDKLWTIEFIYLVFGLVDSGDSHAVSRFVALFKKYPAKAWITKSKIRASLEFTNIEPLRLTSAHYGSPASFDLLGIGRILEILRDTIKDLVWHGRHERQIAELERQTKEAEIEKLRLESDRIITDIAAKRIELIERASKLKLSDEDKRVFIQALLTPMRMIAMPVPLLLENRKPRRVVKGKRNTKDDTLTKHGADLASRA